MLDGMRCRTLITVASFGSHLYKTWPRHSRLVVSTLLGSSKGNNALERSGRMVYYLRFRATEFTQFLRFSERQEWGSAESERAGQAAATQAVLGELIKSENGRRSAARVTGIQ